LPLDLFVSDADESDIEPPRPAPPRVVETGRLCQWCAAPVDPTADTCPACGSNVQGDSEQSIPGLTELTEVQEDELDRPLRLPRGADANVLLDLDAGRIIIKLIDD
jgi:hypothetical protein